jgi:hypothetical protein
MLAVTSPTSGGRSVGIVRSRTQATEFLFGGNYSLSVIADHDKAALTCDRYSFYGKKDVMVGGEKGGSPVIKEAIVSGFVRLGGCFI